MHDELETKCGLCIHVSRFWCCAHTRVTQRRILEGNMDFNKTHDGEVQRAHTHRVTSTITDKLELKGQEQI